MSQSPVTDAPSHADRVAKLEADRAELKAKHEARLAELRAQIAAADAAHTTLSSKIESEADTVNEAAHVAFQRRAADTLDPIVAEYIQRGDRQAAVKVEEAVRALNAEALNSLGHGLEHELAHSFAAQIVTKDPTAAANFANRDTFMCTVLGCGEASFAAVKILTSTTEISLITAALERLERDTARARQNNAVARGAERWQIVRHGGSKKSIAAQLAVLDKVEADERSARGREQSLGKLRGWDILRALAL